MRKVHSAGLRERHNMRQNKQFERKKQELDEEYGKPCEECGVRVEQEELDGIGGVEYPAGSHAIGCSLAGPGSYHPQDERVE